MPKKAVRKKTVSEPIPEPRPWAPGWLVIHGARQNNLKSIDVPIPLGTYTCITGVSGSGKSSLVEEVLYKSLARTLHRAQGSVGAHDLIEGVEQINKVIRVDQQPLGQTPTSNPATYTGAFELIRDLFAQLPDARVRGYSARRFSFNVPGGRCEKCEGNGQIKIEMHFLPDVWITCDACNGKRYDKQTLDVKFHGFSISDVLEMSCGDALRLFVNVPNIRRILQTLCDVGLDYLSLGQPAPTLSGGEAQRVKLAAELARPDTGRTLYLLDEPTTGLHFEDLTKLLEMIQRLVDLGNTVIVIEHNLDMIKSADWIVDLGPEAGLEGGYLVFAGTPEQLITNYELRITDSKKRKGGFYSHTAAALAPVLALGNYEERKPYIPGSVPKTIEPLERFPVFADSSEDAKMPWETDGRRWHTKDRLSRGGLAIRWDGRILADVVDRIQESDIFAETNWNHRTVVEISAEKKTLGWFFHAITGEEWLLKMKFRTAKNTFRRDMLVQRLQLKPLNELDDIPLYGTEPRVRIQQSTGPWQEIELKVHSYSEIDREEFWDFLDLAIAGFEKFTDRAKQKPDDLMPWKILKEKWHTIPKGLIGGNKLEWDIAMLDTVFKMLGELAPNAKPVWTNKVLVPYYVGPPKKVGGRILPWVIVGTKRCDALYVDIYVQKNAIPLGKIRQIGFEPNVNGSNPEYDILELRFRNKAELSNPALRETLRETLDARAELQS
ncbi:MAG: ATP-binding cassette domain-containing protein [Planctomycetaceae bacterium]|nr:ATP-binding cassette domain-containing protein [Planctomycetaceae bacterium]